MAANPQVKSPFLGASPASFERLDSPDSNNQTSAMQSSVSSQEVNSWWDNYLAPTTEGTSIENSNVAKPLETPVFSQPEVTTIGETKISSFSVKGEIVFNQKETVLSQTVIAEGSVDIKTEQAIDVSEKSTTSISGILEKIDLSPALKATKTVKSASKDTKKAIWELFRDYIMVKPEKKEEQKEEKKKSSPKSGFTLPGISNERKQAISRQVEDINRKIKGTNTSYEGILNSDGSVRADIQALLDKTNSELEEAQLKKKKEAQMANLGGTSKKGAKGPRVSTNLNQAPEDSNSASKLLG